MRITSGRYRDERAIRLTDAELTDRLLADFAPSTPTPVAPSAVRVVRWPLAFPQYEPGHGERVDATMAALESSDSEHPRDRQLLPRHRHPGHDPDGAGTPPL